MQPKVSVKAVADTIEATEDELVITGAGKFFLSGVGGFAQRYSGQDDMVLRVTMIEAASEVPVVIAQSFSRIKDAKTEKEPNRWSLTR